VGWGGAVGDKAGARVLPVAPAAAAHAYPAGRAAHAHARIVPLSSITAMKVCACMGNTVTRLHGVPETHSYAPPIERPPTCRLHLQQRVQLARHDVHVAPA
jgi:hypothetical protein